MSSSVTESESAKRNKNVSFQQEEGVQGLSSSGRALQEIGANSFVLAIGETVSKQELRPVVIDAEEDLFTVKTFEGLTWLVRRLAYTIVQRTVGSSGTYSCQSFSQIFILLTCCSFAGEILVL